MPTPTLRPLKAFTAEAAGYVQRADFPQVIRLLDRFFGHAGYSLTSLFGDEQRRIVKLILNSTLTDVETSLTTIYQNHASLLHFSSRPGCPNRLRSRWPRVSPSMPACAAPLKPIQST